MPDLFGLLNILHQAVVGLFLLVTFLLMGITIMNRLRIRRVFLSWSTGRLFGLPLLPTLFIGLILPLFVHSLMAGPDQRLLQPLLLAGYLAGGLFWYVAALLSQALVVTDFGLVRSANRLGQAVAWGQVEDYFENTEDDRQSYVFLYGDRDGSRQRLELNVPCSYRERFRQIVAAKVDARFEFTLHRTYGKTALNE